MSYRILSDLRTFQSLTGPEKINKLRNIYMQLDLLCKEKFIMGTLNKDDILSLIEVNIQPAGAFADKNWTPAQKLDMKVDAELIYKNWAEQYQKDRLAYIAYGSKMPKFPKPPSGFSRRRNRRRKNRKSKKNRK